MHSIKKRRIFVITKKQNTHHTKNPTTMQNSTPIAKQRILQYKGETYTATQYYSLRAPYRVENSNGEFLGELWIIGEDWRAVCADGNDEHFCKGQMKAAALWIIKNTIK